ncbi:hypothetical protein Tco_0123943, partial [Tanacetum coccineum]
LSAYVDCRGWAYVDDWTRSPSRDDEEGLEAGIEHGKAGRSLAVVEAYDVRVEANRGWFKDPRSIKSCDFCGVKLPSCCRGARFEKHKKAHLEIGGPSVVTLSLSSQGTSLAATHHHVSRADNVNDTFPFSEPHDYLFDATILDKPMDS